MVPKEIRLIAIIATVFLIVMSSLRVIFWLAFRDPQIIIPIDALSQAFYLGLKYDLRCILLILIPLSILIWVPILNPLQNCIAKIGWLVYFSIIGFLLLFIYSIDFGYYDYLESRLDASVLRFLSNPYESFGVLWEGYPVLIGTLSLLICTFGLIRIINWTIRKLQNSSHSRYRRWHKAAIIGIAIMIYSAGVYGKFSYYPLRWSDAYFSTDDFISAIALNPVLYFVDTFKNKEIEYNATKVKANYDFLTTYLGVKQPDKDKLNFSRPISSSAIQVNTTPNVVIILLESFASFKTGISGNPLDPSPNFDEITRNGIYFSKFYAPHGGTARAVFASLVGLPDVEKNKTSSRNPLVVNQHTIVNSFVGYEKFYFLGGSASWANIRALLQRNIPDIKIYEEGSYNSPRMDVWGISDLHLFEEANTVLNQVDDQPFFAVIHTSGNHSPFNIPDDNRGFISKKITDKEVKKYGFKSAKDYNAFRFMDHSLGQFFQLARQQKYFNNTIFVLYADHGSPGGSQHQPIGERLLPLDRHHIPLVFYAPNLLKSNVIETVGSSIDVLPTIAGLASVESKNTTLGRNLFDTRFENNRYALTISRAGKYHVIGLLNDEYYYLVGNDGSNPRLHKIDSINPPENLLNKLPNIASQLNTQVFALYETAKYMRYHNN